MAELPSVPIPNTTTQPIKYNLTAADIQSPYTAIAQASDKASQGLEDISVPLAQQAASKMVRTDDQGNPVVDSLPPLLGNAARAARLTIAGQMQPQIENGILKQRLANPYDPEAFGKAAREYKTTVMGKISDPALSTGLGMMFDRSIAQNLRSSMVEKDSHDLAMKKETFDARQKDVDDQSALLARQGPDGINSDAYRANQQTRMTLINDRQSDPRTAQPPEVVARYLHETYDNDQAQAIIGQRQRDYQATEDKAAGKVAAQKALYDDFLGPGSKLKYMPIEKRNHYFSEGMHGINMLSVKDADAISANRTAQTGWINGTIADPEHYDPQMLQNFRQRAQSLDDPTALGELRALENNIDMIKHFAHMTPPELATARNKLMRGINPETDQPFDFTDPGTERLYRTTLAKEKVEAEKGAEQQVAALRAKSKLPDAQFSQQEFEDAIYTAHFASKPELVKEVQALAAAQVRANKVPIGTGNVAMERARQELAGNPNLTLLERKTGEKYLELLGTYQKGWEADPMGQGAAAGLYARPAPFDTGDPNAAANWAERGHNANLIRQAYEQNGAQRGDIPLITGGNATDFGKQIVSGPSDQVAKTLGAMGIGATPGDFKATFQQKDIAEAMKTAVNTRDPVRLKAVMGVLDQLRTKFPNEFEPTYGKGVQDKLFAWRSRNGAVPPEQIIEDFQNADDPHEKAGRVGVDKAVDKELGGLTPSDIAFHLGKSALDIRNPYTGREPLIGPEGGGGTPLLPRERDWGTLVTDYTELYKAQRELGAEPNKAREAAIAQLRDRWGASVAGNGMLMRDPPEKYGKFYPPMGDPTKPGAYDWLVKDRDETMTRILGPQMTLKPGATGEGGPTDYIVHWRVKDILADATTREQAARGDKPSYVIHYVDENGNDQTLKDPVTNTRRFTFDPGTARTPTAEPTGGFADFEARQKAEGLRKDATAKRLLSIRSMPGMRPFNPLLNLFDAHAEYRDGRQ
jgi:hypothetical protein